MSPAAAIDKVETGRPDSLVLERELDEARVLLCASGLMDLDWLATIARDLALVPKEQRRALFVERAKAVGEFVRDGLLDAANVHEALWRIATAHGLVGLPGSLKEEFISYVIDTAAAIEDEQGEAWRRRWRL